MMDPSWCGADIILFNYGISRWNMFPRQSGRISFFWKGVLSCLPAFRGCVQHEVNSGTETLFWKDRWLAGSAPMYIWPEEFLTTPNPNGTIRDFLALLHQHPFSEDRECRTLGERLQMSVDVRLDNKRWKLTGKGAFSVKSFYNFLNDGGLRCLIARFFWRKPCPKKVNLLNWLVWKDRILTLDRLASRGCNRLPTSTCVLCHSAIESVDHLFLTCAYAKQVWEYFVRLLHLALLPSSLQDLWSNW